MKSVSPTQWIRRNLLIGILSILLWSPGAFADTQEYVPTGDGSPTTWTNGFAAVDETVAAANDTDFIISNTAGQIELFTFSQALPGGSTVNSVTVNFRCNKVTGGTGTWTVAGQIERSNTASTGANNTMTTTFTNFTRAMTTCPVSTCSNGTGGAWTTTDLDNLEFGVNTTAVGNKDIKCSQVSVTIDYTPPTRRRIITVE